MRVYYNYSIGGQIASYNNVTYERTITIDNTGNPGSLDDCQVKITLNASNFDFTHAESDGSDLRFFESDGVTALNFWIQSYNAGTELATIWVKVQGVNALSTGTIILKYGDAAAAGGSDFSDTMETWAVGGDITNLFVKSSYTGVLDTYSAAGSITCDITPSGTFTNTRVFAKFNTAAYADFIDLYIDINSRLVLRVCKNGTTKTSGDVSNSAQASTTVLASGTTYTITFAWDQMWKIVYLNGNIECKVFSDTPTNGAFAPFTAGSLDTGQDPVSNTFPGTIASGFITNTKKQRQHAEAYYEKRQFYYKDEESKWIKLQAPRFRPGGLPVFEPSILYEGGVYKLWYSKLYSTNRTAVYYATTTDLSLGFTEVQRVLGSGSGGEALDVSRSSIYKEGSTYYIYYVPYTAPGGIGVPNSIYVASSSDGITFSGNQVAFDKGVTPGFQNTHVTKVDSTYHMYYDIDDGGLDVADRYKIGHATASNVLGPFTADPANPLQSANYGLAATTYGAAWPTYFNSKLYMWFLQTPPEKGVNILPSEIYRADSTDFSTFTKPYTRSVIAIDSYQDEFDQVSDPVLFEENGNTWMLSADNDNAIGGFYAPNTFKAVINFHKFSGTMEQLVTDLTVTVGSETEI